MAFPLFRSWWPVGAGSWHISSWYPKSIKIITNDRNGAPIGLQSQNANGPDGIWAPTPITVAQSLAPDANMLADLNATYQLHQAPYTRYYSDGTQFVPMSAEGGTVIPPGINEIFFSPLTITEAGGPLIIQGGLRLVA